MSERTARRARRQAAASARRLQRLERTRQRGPLAFAGTLLVVAAGGAVAVVALAAVTGRFEVPPPPNVTIDLASSTAATPTPTALVVRIENGSGDPDLTAEVARHARVAGIHGFEVAPDAAWSPDTRILVHHDVPEVVAAAADLRDLIGAGVVERVEARGHSADLTVVVGVDARDPA